MRHKEPALVNGSYLALNEDDPNVLCYLRKYKDEAVLVVLNMSDKPQKVRIDLASAGFSAPKLSPMLSTPQSPAAAVAGGAVAIEPFGVLIAKVGK